MQPQQPQQKGGTIQQQQNSSSRSCVVQFGPHSSCPQQQLMQLTLQAVASSAGAGPCSAAMLKYVLFFSIMGPDHQQNIQEYSINNTCDRTMHHHTVQHSTAYHAWARDMLGPCAYHDVACPALPLSYPHLSCSPTPLSEYACCIITAVAVRPEFKRGVFSSDALPGKNTWAL